MQGSVQEKLRHLRAVREDTLKLVAHLGQDQSEFSPSSGRWSVGEVLDHLIRSERLYRGKFVELVALACSGREPVLRVRFSDVNVSIGYVPKPIMKIMETPLSIMNTFIPRGLRTALVQHRVIPAQAPTVAEPTQGRPLVDLRAELQGAQMQMEELFADNSTLDYERMRVIHPLMGDNNVPQLLQFVASHECRHQNQIRDLLKLPTFPGSKPAVAAT